MTVNGSEPMTDEEFYERTANWLREEQGSLVDSIYEIEEDPSFFVVDVCYDYRDEDGYHHTSYEYAGTLEDLKAEVEPYED
jgi:hypothetical protein